jgi:cullin-associated NEDD8-dissociated protein 1
VSRTGSVALVHNPVVDRFSRYKTEVNVDIDNLNYFRVAWENDHFYPSPQNSCGNINVCTLRNNGEECLCDITISEELVFASLPNVSEVLSQLFIGGFDVSISDGYTLLESNVGVKVYERLGGGYNIDTLFEVEYFGESLFLKNMRSIVHIGEYSFRNPVQFLDPAHHEGRDAHYETEAILKHYVRHPNVAPFLAVRFIKRFGTSNPSPRYVEDVATAFTVGEYTVYGHTYGDGRYGSMEAMIAAIILHDEARTALLDADPTAGSLREPLLKLIAFLRSMEFTSKSINPEIRLKGLEQKIGQEVYAIPNVFSYFLPEFAAAGHIDDASITSPEAQVMNGPKLTAFTNGLFALVDLGLNDCFGGFGDRIMGSCNNLLNGRYNPPDFNRGSLTYIPQDNSNSSIVIDDLALLLTGGRMSTTNKMILQDAYETLGGIAAVQKLMTVTPEFHATGLVHDTSLLRPDASAPEASSNRYKSIIILNFSGGADSFNILVPHSECNGKDMYEEYKAVRAGIALNKTSLLEIDTTGSHQICNKFGIHPQLGVLQSMYNDGDLSFISNVGVLQEYASKENWRKKTDDTVLFSHNTQTSEVQNVDIFEAQAGRGVGGRLLDVLGGNGFSANAISAKDAAEALFSRVTPLIVVPSLDDYDKFDPMSADSSNPDIFIEKVKALNSNTNLGSSLFTETYSSTLMRGLSENKLLYDALRETTLNTTFPASSIGKQFESVATMMKTKSVRGVDRDVFFVEQGAYVSWTIFLLLCFLLLLTICVCLESCNRWIRSTFESVVEF